jgi:rod shape-determining protein MreC
LLAKAHYFFEQHFIAPIYQFSAHTHNVINNFQRINQLGSIRQMNHVLRVENNYLQHKISTIVHYQDRYLNFKRSLAYFHLQQGTFLIAEQISPNYPGYHHQVMLSRGQADGVTIGSPVLGTHGIVGQIVSVTATDSRLMFLDDIDSIIPLKSSYLSGQFLGYGQGSGKPIKIKAVYSKIDYLNHHALFAASGLGNRYPAGYPVAYFNHATLVHNKFYTLFLNPLESLNHGHFYVILLNRPPPKIHNGSKHGHQNLV